MYHIILVNKTDGVNFEILSDLLWEKIEKIKFAFLLDEYFSRLLWIFIFTGSERQCLLECCTYLPSTSLAGQRIISCVLKRVIAPQQLRDQRMLNNLYRHYNTRQMRRNVFKEVLTISVRPSLLEFCTLRFQLSSLDAQKPPFF